MKKKYPNIFYGVIAFAVTLFFSCEDNSKALSEINFDSQDPVGTATKIRMVYTDSAKVQAILTAPIHIDYNNLSFQYSEFPEGLKVVFFDDEGNQNEVLANYGVIYEATQLVDLKGNVRLISHDGSILTTQQLYWDSAQEWLFTEEPFTFEDKDYNFDAVRLDTNKDFSKFQTGKLIGTVVVSTENDSIP